MTTNRPDPTLTAMDHFIAVIDSLAGRWADEHEYEDFADYIAAAKKHTPAGMTFKSLTKRPFACVVMEGDDLRHTITVKARGIELMTQRRKTAIVFELPGAGS